MFLDILELIFDNFEGVVRAFDVPLFTVGTVDISFWELLLGIFTVSIIFGFFLVPRPGSVLSAAGNLQRGGRSSEPSKNKVGDK